MKILITGANGQVGYELQHELAGLGDLVAVDRSRMDLSRASSIREVIRKVQPQLIVNAAAYTAVDQAETDRATAFAINADAPAIMAEEAKRLGAGLIHYSTDYVFDGRKQGAYREDDPTAPVNVYGESKLAGEQAVQSQGVPALVFRTQWVYGRRGKNFLLTMLRLAAQRDELKVVNDQFGAPTWSRTIARATAGVVRAGLDGDAQWWSDRSGIYNLVAQGEATWCDFARKIIELSDIPKKPSVVGIPATAYPTPAARPANSRLSCEKFEAQFFKLPQWDEALAECMSAPAVGE